MIVKYNITLLLLSIILTPRTFQRCMTFIFSDMVEGIIEIFMDDFSMMGNSFSDCLRNMTSVLASSFGIKLGEESLYGDGRDSVRTHHLG